MQVRNLQNQHTKPTLHKQTRSASKTEKKDTQFSTNINTDLHHDKANIKDSTDQQSDRQSFKDENGKNIFDPIDEDTVDSKSQKSSGNTNNNNNKSTLELQQPDSEDYESVTSHNKTKKQISPSGNNKYDPSIEEHEEQQEITAEESNNADQQQTSETTAEQETAVADPKPQDSRINFLKSISQNPAVTPQPSENDEPTANNAPTIKEANKDPNAASTSSTLNEPPKTADHPILDTCDGYAKSFKGTNPSAWTSQMMAPSENDLVMLFSSLSSERVTVQNKTSVSSTA